MTEFEIAKLLWLDWNVNFCELLEVYTCRYFGDFIQQLFILHQFTINVPIFYESTKEWISFFFGDHQIKWKNCEH